MTNEEISDFNSRLPHVEISDPRHIANGWIIPTKYYADQPYIVKTDDGAWLCTVTTGSGHEGTSGQHVVSMRSLDRGKTWSAPINVEPPDGPEASYAVLLKVPSGRIYCLYNHNTDRVAEVKREDGFGVIKRVDCLGHYVFKYSDDHGKTWSNDRYEIPVRAFDYDRDNVCGGDVQFFWNVGRPLILGNAVFSVIHKVGAFGAGLYAKSEGAFLKSTNLLTERDPAKIVFETLPEGTVGLRAPEGGGSVAEEQSFVSLSDGSLFCVYRTVDGWPACSYSRDGARIWSKPSYMTFTPGGRRVKHPRAANFVWRCSNGKFLYWFHNHGGHFIGDLIEDGVSRSPYEDRNPVWLMAGREIDTNQGRMIEWSQPEILLYDDDPYIRVSYPDLVEEDGQFFVTETQKKIGRTHAVPAVLLQGLFNQWDARAIAQEGLVLDLSGKPPVPTQIAMPKLPALNQRTPNAEDQRGQDLRTGFSFELSIKLDVITKDKPLLDNRDVEGKGVVIYATEAGTVRIVLHDGRSEASGSSDDGLLQAGRLHHVVVTVDGGPKIITFVVDGILCDGGEQRQFGWRRYSPNLRTPVGAAMAVIDPSIQTLRIYDRALSTSEAVSNFHAVST